MNTLNGGSNNEVDLFDIESLRLSQAFTETVGVKKILSTVPVRRPHPQEFVRVHPSPEYRCDFAMVELKEDREDFLVRPEVLHELAGETVHKTLFTAISRQGVTFLWPVRLPDPDDRRRNEWTRSSREAAELAMGKWIRVKANMHLGAYEMAEATGLMADPVWPELGFQELLRIAFRDRMIASVDHPVVQRLRGLA